MYQAPSARCAYGYNPTYTPMFSTYGARFSWIFEHRNTSAYRLSSEAGLADSYLRGLLRQEAAGKKIRPGAEAIAKLAKVARVDARWLAEGVGSPDGSSPAAAPAPAPEPPPPASSSRPTGLAIDGLIDAAFDPARHKVSDAILARAALEQGDQLLRGVDLTDYARALLDAAARARGAGARPEASALHALAIRELQEALRMARAAGFLPRLAPLDQIDEQPGDSDRGKGL